MSRRNTDKNPLKISEANGAIPSACSALATKPITKSPRIKTMLPLAAEGATTDFCEMLGKIDLLEAIKPVNNVLM